jgi:TP901 family phage tail tape measure protein
MKAFSKAVGDIGNYQKLQQRVTANQSAMLAMRKEAGALAASSLPEARKQAEALSAKAETLQKRLDRDREALSRLRPELAAAGIDTKNLASEQARLAEKSAKLTQAHDRLAASQARLDATKDTLSNARGDILASAGWLMVLKAPIQASADFEQAAAQVKAVSGATAEEIAELSKQGRQLGRDTQFTATQVVNAQEMMARAGFKTEEILKSMPGLLDMTAAEGMDLATATDIAASALRGFQLDAGQMGRVSDVLAKASAASNSSISSLGESMKMVAPIAAGLNIPLEETAAMIGVMSDVGIKGSEAGTALRAALVRLSKEPKATAKALETLGVATRDVKGNLRTIPTLMQDMARKMAGMGDADKTKFFAETFGTEAVSGMMAVMDAAGTGKLQEFTEELYKSSGAAAEMAAIMNDTAQGAMKRLSSAWESLNIDAGNAVLPAFADIIEKLASSIGWLSEKAQKFPAVTKAVTGFVVAIGSYKVASTGLKVASAAMKLPFLEIAVGVNKFRAALALADGSILTMIKNTKLAKAATVAWTAVQWLWNGAMSVGRRLLGVGKLIAYKAAQLAIAVASKAWAAAQWILNAALTANPIGLVVVAIAALVGAFVLAYKKCDWFREKVDSAMAAIKAIFLSGFEKISAVISKAGELWGKFKNALGIAPKIPVPETTAVQAGNAAASPIAAHAAGGIFSKPHLGMIAEGKSTESIIPHDSGGERIWQATGEMAGFSMPDAGGGAAYNVTVGLTVNTQPGSDGNDIGRQALRLLEQELPRLLQRCEEQRLRVAY